jgi:dihydropyrimidinase
MNDIRLTFLIEGEKISQIGQNLNPSQCRDCRRGGAIRSCPVAWTSHVHLDLPMFNTISSDDHYTGGKAAAFGGTTTVIDFVPQDEGSLGRKY